MKSLDIRHYQAVCAGQVVFESVSSDELVFNISGNSFLELSSARFFGFDFPIRFVFNRVGLWYGEDFLGVEKLQTGACEVSGMSITAQSVVLDGEPHLEFHIKKCI